MTHSEIQGNKANQTVLILFVCLVLLVVLLILLYKKLNKDTNGEYTVRRMVYKEGGVRDQVRGAAMVVETHLGVNLWPRSDAAEDAEEMQELRDETGKVERGSQRAGSDGDEEDSEEEEGVCGERKGEESDSSNSSLSGSDLQEEAKLKDQEEAEEKRDGEGNEEGEVRGGASLLIDLKQFSGSAIWSEEERNGDNHTTAL